MSPAEARQSAIEEFTTQGVDLSNIYKGCGDISSHPAAQAVAALKAALETGDAAGMATAADSIVASLSEPDALVVLHNQGAVHALMQGGQACQMGVPGMARVLCCLAALLGAARNLQADFLALAGPAPLLHLLDAHPDDAMLATAVLRVAVAAGLKNEEGKAALVAAGYGSRSLQVLQRLSEQPEALAAACGVLCTLTNPDDDTQPSSSAFKNARALAKEGAAKQLVATLQQHKVYSVEATIALATALKQVAANDEICQDVAVCGGVQLALDSLEEAGMKDARLARALCALLRQLASSDSVKPLLMEGGSLELLSNLLAVHASSPAVLEQALGLLTNITLRNPEAGSKAADCGCLDAVLMLMARLLEATETLDGNGKEKRLLSAVQRQACMAIRNIAARNPEVRALLLDKGAEGLLRQVKAAYPSCADVASAALRDLGCDNYI